MPKTKRGGIVGDVTHEVMKLLHRPDEGRTNRELLAFAAEARGSFPHDGTPANQVNLACVVFIEAIARASLNASDLEVTLLFGVAADACAEANPQLSMLARWHQAAAMLTWEFPPGADAPTVRPVYMQEVIGHLTTARSLTEDIKYLFLINSLLAECWLRVGNADHARTALLASNTALEGIAPNIEAADDRIIWRIRVNAAMAQTQCEGPLPFPPDYRKLMGFPRELREAVA